MVENKVLIITSLLPKELTRLYGLVTKSEVKEELSRHLGKSRHCQIAELAALIAFDGKVQVSESGCDLFLDSENELLNTKYDLLLKKLLIQT